MDNVLRHRAPTSRIIQLVGHGRRIRQQQWSRDRAVDTDRPANSNVGLDGVSHRRCLRFSGVPREEFTLASIRWLRLARGTNETWLGCRGYGPNRPQAITMAISNNGVVIKGRPGFVDAAAHISHSFRKIAHRSEKTQLTHSWSWSVCNVCVLSILVWVGLHPHPICGPQKTPPGQPHSLNILALQGIPVWVDPL